LHSNDDARALRFAFLPGQQLEAHESPHSPVHLVVLQGTGEFTGRDGKPRRLGPGTLVVFDTGESHTVRALDEELVYLSIYNGAAHQYESEHRKMLEANEQED
jgi:quercetin dioxygenase-like cupin family protein